MTVRNLQRAGIRSLILFAITGSVATAFAGEDPGQCELVPPRISIPLPDSGLHWVDGYESAGVCEPVEDEAWLRTPHRSQNLLVNAHGPSGSGRYWRITVALTSDNSRRLQRGFCLTTSTLGWRTLQRFQRTPLPWIGDPDGDGRPEFILWDSFPVAPGPGSMSEYALVAWAYQVSAANTLTIDWGATRRLGLEIAEAYREPLEGANSRLLALRKQASRTLLKFASEICESGGG